MSTDRDTIDLLRTLRAVRRYAPRPLDPASLDRVIEAARWTGSAKNRQPWSLVLVENPETLAELSTCGAYASHLAGAPAALVLAMDPTSPLAAFDAGRLSQTIMLAAWSEGIGSCIATLFPEENLRRVRALLGVPDGLDVWTAIALGYPADAEATRLSSAPPNVRAEVPLGRIERDRFLHRERWNG